METLVDRIAKKAVDIALSKQDEQQLNDSGKAGYDSGVELNKQYHKGRSIAYGPTSDIAMTNELIDIIKNGDNVAAHYFAFYIQHRIHITSNSHLIYLHVLFSVVDKLKKDDARKFKKQCIIALGASATDDACNSKVKKVFAKYQVLFANNGCNLAKQFEISAGLVVAALKENENKRKQESDKEV